MMKTIYICLAVHGAAVVQAQCTAGQRNAYDDSALAFRFKHQGISSSGTHGDRSLVWAAESEGAVAAAGATGMSFTMTRPDDPLGDPIWGVGEFIEPCLAEDGCPGIPEACHPGEADTTCELTATIPDDPATPMQNEYVLGTCAPTPATGTCTHQPAEVPEAALAPTLGGLYFESGEGSSFEQTMYSDKNIAIGGEHTFFMVFTHAATASLYETMLGFRTNNRPGCFAFGSGQYGCGADSVGCLQSDDWGPTGYMGPGYAAGTTSIAIFRSRLDYDTTGSYAPISDFALVTDTSELVFVAGAMHNVGLQEYSDPKFEDFDYDFRDPDLDGYKAIAAGYPKLGHTSLLAAPYVQFRGTIHHFELHSKMLSSDEVADVVATLIPHFIDSSAGNPGACFDCPAGSSDADNDPTTACTPCAAGKFSSAIGVAGECAGTCPAGQSFDGTGAVDDQGCTACVAGTYENGGVCTGCPAGKFSAAVGATDQSTCVDCAAGLGSSAGGTECIASGCTDNLSPNYSADAVVDDGSCEYTCDALRTSLDITAPGGCLIYDSTTSGWKNYNADGTLSTTPDATFVFPPEQEHWIVQGLPLAGSSDGAFLYPSYPSNLMVRNARMTVRYVDVSDNNCSDGDCAPLTGYAAGISIEAVTPCTFASPAREKWCFLDVDHASMNNNYADVSAATCQQTEINGDGTMATRSSSMKYVTYTANSAGDNGAAAWVGSGTHIIQNNVYDGNVLIGSGTQIGGALFLINNLPGSDCWLLLESSAFKNNAAIQGGAIFMGTGTKASLSQVTFDSNQAKSIGGAINMLATAALEMRSTTFVDNMANGQGATVYSEQPLSIKIVDADFSANGGSDSVHIAGTTGDCSVHPCDPGQSCAYTDYSLTCTACPDNTYSTDGITCGLCPDGQTPSADKTSCEACPAETIASSGFCATAPAPTVCEECEVTPCPAVTPAPAPTTSAGRRRQLQPVEAVQSLLPFMAPLLALLGIAARFN